MEWFLKEKKEVSLTAYEWPYLKRCKSTEELMFGENVYLSRITRSHFLSFCFQFFLLLWHLFNSFIHTFKYLLSTDFTSSTALLYFGIVKVHCHIFWLLRTVQMLSLQGQDFNANFKIFHLSLEFLPFLILLQPTPLIQAVGYQERGKWKVGVACKIA